MDAGAGSPDALIAEERKTLRKAPLLREGGVVDCMRFIDAQKCMLSRSPAVPACRWLTEEIHAFHRRMALRYDGYLLWASGFVFQRLRMPGLTKL
jgi:hypothetical protein